MSASLPTSARGTLARPCTMSAVYANETILSADVNRNGEKDNEDARAIAVLSGDAKLDGLVFADAYDDDCMGLATGGAVTSRGHDLSLIRCVFEGNSVKENAGAINCRGGSVLVTSCVIGGVGNCTGPQSSWNRIVASEEAAYTVEHSLFVGGDNYSGFSAISGGSGRVENCTFDCANFYHNAGAGHAEVWNCEFTGSSDNPTPLLSAGEGDIRVVSCTFSGNGSGAVFMVDANWWNTEHGAPELINCVFTGNSNDEGGALRCENRSVILTYCTFAGNESKISDGGAIYSFFVPEYGGSKELALRNCILFGNEGEFDTFDEWSTELVCYGGTIEASHSLIQSDDGPSSNAYPGTGNRNFASPGFDGSSLELATGSDCIDAGSKQYLPGDVTTDRAGMPRVSGTANEVDMGAYEFQQP